MGKSTRFAIERNQTLPHRVTMPDAQSKRLVELDPSLPTLTCKEELSPEDRARHFIEAVKELGARESESEAGFNAKLKKKSARSPGPIDSK